MPEISTVRLLFQIVIDPEKTGKLYKIRVGLAEQTFGAHWFLEKVLCPEDSRRKKNIILFKIKKIVLYYFLINVAKNVPL